MPTGRVKDTDQRHHGHFFEQLGLEGIDRPVDETRAVIAIDNHHPFWQSCFQRLELGFYMANHLE
jgi:hypothetical protein